MTRSSPVRVLDNFLSKREILFWGLLLSFVGMLDAVLILSLPILFGGSIGNWVSADVIQAFIDRALPQWVSLEVFLGALVVIKVMLFLALNRAVIFFVSYKQIDITKDVIKQLSRLNFLQFESLDFNAVVRLVSASIPRFIEESLFSSIRLLGESLSLCIIVIALFLLNPWLTIFMIVCLAGVAALFRLAFTPVIKRSGQGMIAAQSRIIGLARQYISGFREIKIDSNHDRFLDSIDSQSEQFARLGASYTVLQLVPRQLLELIFFVVIIASITYLLRDDTDINLALASLSGFGFAAVRSIPAINNVITSLNKLAVSAPILEELVRFHDQSGQYLGSDNDPVAVAGNSERARPDLSLSTKTSLVGKNLSFSYEAVPVLRDVSFEFEQGAVNVLTGPSGCGKSTLIGLILNQLGRYDGEILLNGIDIKEVDGWPYKFVKYNSQRPVTYDGTVADNITITSTSGKEDMERIIGLIETTGIDAAATFAEKDVGDEGLLLSGGEKQRVAIARALFSDKEILILDEPTANLDTAGSEVIRRLLDRVARERLVIVITHDPVFFSDSLVLRLGAKSYDP